MQTNKSGKVVSMHLAGFGLERSLTCEERKPLVGDKSFVLIARLKRQLPEHQYEK
jgi:hypothetical protein